MEVYRRRRPRSPVDPDRRRWRQRAAAGPSRRPAPPVGGCM